MTTNPNELVTYGLGDTDSDTEKNVTQSEPEPESNASSDSRFTDAVSQADPNEIGKKLSIVHKMDRSQKSFSNLYSEKTKVVLTGMDIGSKDKLNFYLQKKLNKLMDRLKILQIKYMSYKRWYDACNISIIIASAMLSVFEAFRNELAIFIEEDSIGEICMNMVPITVSTSITCSAAIIKFKKFQEKMENMQFTREKFILSISKIKNIQESLWFAKDEKAFQAIKDKYISDIYGFYNECNSELERQIKFSDYDKLTEKNIDRDKLQLKYDIIKKKNRESITRINQ
jgi:hypothetical protein